MQSAETKAQSEVLYLLLRRMRILEEDVERVPAALDEVRLELVALREQLGSLEGGDRSAMGILERLADIEETLRGGSGAEMVRPIGSSPPRVP